MNLENETQQQRQKEKKVCCKTFGSNFSPRTKPCRPWREFEFISSGTIKSPTEKCDQMKASNNKQGKEERESEKKQHPATFVRAFSHYVAKFCVDAMRCRRCVVKVRTEMKGKQRAGNGTNPADRNAQSWDGVVFTGDKLSAFKRHSMGRKIVSIRGQSSG